ncbi:MAG: rhodanese family protein [Planctomycetota bacterium]|nr:rhodanese family protein [Planctomycetota bacterium]
MSEPCAERALSENPRPAVLTPAQVQRWLSTGACVLIDVREPDEFARERIEGSTLLPLSAFDPVRVASLARPGVPIVIHCKAGKRSADAVARCGSLAASGAQVLSLPGGIDAWKAAGLPVAPARESAPGPAISVMRQTQLIIGAVVLAGALAGWFVHPGFLALPAFMGAGLIVAGATGTCGLATLVGALPWNRAHSGACPL